MRKRIAVFLTVVLLLSQQAVVNACASMDFFIKSPAQNGTSYTDTLSFFTHSPFIVKFKASVSETTADETLSAFGYEVISDGIYRVVCAENELKQACGELTEYICPDEIRSLCAVTDDPLASELPEFTLSGFYTAWDKATATEQVTVAVLDTGVDRTHPDLVNARILAGYDAVTRKRNVNGDGSGHGTKVCGIISASGNNGIGTAGAAYGVTVLPICVTRSEELIYTSDIIAGLHYAADAGAKIINMSFGGYTYSYAEQEAVNYCLDRGCIIIAAAGNDGRTDYGDKKCYPASYDGVISVGSCGATGKTSAFSQHNDSVDLCAPGENITVLQSGGYASDSGTSFSAALVTATAALCLSILPYGVRLGADEFMSLITSSCGTSRNDYGGYGILKADDIVERSTMPIVTGVRNGGEYHGAATVYFNRGTAELDGVSVRDGETVLENGVHSLVLSNEAGEYSISFVIHDYEPKYTYNEYETYAEFVFESGYAELDGVPYGSGDRIVESGEHIFTLTASNLTVSRTVAPEFTVLPVNGIANGGHYTRPVMFETPEGSYLNGEAVSGKTILDESGSYEVTTPDGGIFRFTVELSAYDKTDASGTKVAADASRGITVTYDVGANGFKATAADGKAHYISSPRLLGCCIFGNTLAAVCKNRITLFGLDSIASGNPAIELDLETEAELISYACDGAHLYVADETEIFWLNGSLLASLCKPLLRPAVLSCDGGLVAASDSESDDRMIFIYNSSTGDVSALLTDMSVFGKTTLVYGNGVFCGGSYINMSDGKRYADTGFDEPLYAGNGIIVFSGGVCDAATLRTLCVFGKSASSAYVSGDKLYIIQDETLTVVDDYDKNGYGGANITDISSSRTNKHTDYSTRTVFSGTIVDSALHDGVLYVIFENDMNLYSYDALTFAAVSQTKLRFIPQTLQESEGTLLVSFYNRKAFYMQSSGKGEYRYLSFVPDRLYISGDYVFTTVGGMLRRCHLPSMTVEETMINAKKLLTSGSKLFVSFGRAIGCYDAAAMEVLFSAEADGEISTMAASETLLAAGGTVFDITTGEKLYSAAGKPSAFSENRLFTSSGVYDGETLIAEIGYKSNRLLCDGGKAILVGDNSVYVFDVTALSSEITVDGIEDGGIYQGGVVFECPSCVTSVNGFVVDGTVTISDGGSYTVKLCLPFGSSRIFRFSVIPALSEISVASHTRYLGEGGTLSLKVLFLPEGASSVPLVFSSNSASAVVDASGNVTAVSEGYATITVSTSDGMFSDTYTVKVTNDIIMLDENAPYTIDREDGVIKGIMPGTNASEMLRNITSQSVTLTNPDGTKAVGYVATGMLLTLYGGGGEITETLTVAVVGDVDGDGCVTVGDLPTISDILHNRVNGTAAQRAAADVNGNSNVNNSDLSAILSQLLFHREYVSNPPVPELSDALSITLYAQQSAYSGSDLYFAISLDNCASARAVSGRVYFDRDLLSYSEIITSGLSVSSYEAHGYVSFVVCNPDYSSLGESNPNLLIIRFTAKKLKETASAEFTFADGVVLNEKEVVSIRGETAVASVASEAYEGLFSINVVNSHTKLNFSGDVTEYELLLNPVMPFADILVTAPSDSLVIVGDCIIGNNPEKEVRVTYTDGDGATETYTLKLIHKAEDEPEKDGDSALASLSVEGLALEPAFSPDIYEYTVKVDFDGDFVNPSYTCRSAAASAELKTVMSDSDSRRVTVTCTAQDGTQTVYTVNYIRNPLPQQSEAESSEDNGTESNTGIIYVVAFSALAAGAAATILLLIRRKRNAK